MSNVRAAGTTMDEPWLLVHAYLDGELDPANSLAIAQRIAADPALGAEVERIQALRQATPVRIDESHYAPMRGAADKPRAG